MALDIARVVRFGRPDGTMAATLQRHHLVVVDGIVGGEGEGAVYPTGIPLGVVMFGLDPVWTDYAAALVMHFDPRKIALVSRATDRMRWPVAETAKDELQIAVDGSRVDFSALRDVLNRGFVPPKVGEGGSISRFRRWTSECISHVLNARNSPQLSRTNFDISPTIPNLTPLTCPQVRERVSAKLVTDSRG